MTHMVHCLKLNKEAEGLDHTPYPGEIGQKVYDNICKEAWGLWLNQQTMLINEYRLSMVDPKARAFLLVEMENFLFGKGSTAPAGYTPLEK